MAESSSEPAERQARYNKKRKLSRDNKTTFGIEISVGREDYDRLGSIKQRWNKVKDALKSKTPKSKTQNADIMEALLDAYENANVMDVEEEHTEPDTRGEIKIKVSVKFTLWQQ